MSCNSGPDISNRGLVLSLDQENTQKSWRGKPTVNLQLPNVINWSNTAIVTLLSEVSPIGTPVYSVTDNSSGYLASTRNLTVANDSNTYTISLYIKKTYGATSARLGFNTSFTGGATPIYYNQRFNSDTGAATTGAVENLSYWWRWDFQITNNSTGNTTLGCSFYPATGLYDSGDNAVATGTAIVSSVQIEQNTFATPFVNGTRSVTQSLLDITGDNTIDATNLTFNSRGLFEYNGTSNYIRNNINHSYLSSSAIEVVFSSVDHPATGKKYIAGYRHNGGFSYPTTGSIYIDGNILSASLITASQVYRTVTSPTLIQRGVPYHVVFNKDTTNGVMELYVNGDLKGTQTFDAATYAQWTTAGSYIGADIFEIGKSTNTSAGQGWSTDYFKGTIPTTNVYDRVLTATEIKKNYTSYRRKQLKQGIVTEGLVYNIDAGQTASYPGSGTVWTDLTGGVGNLTLANSPTFSSADTGSLVFDGVDDHGFIASGAIPVTSPISVTANFTIEVIFKPTAYQASNYYGITNNLLGKGTAGTYNYSVQPSNDTTFAFIKRSGSEGLQYHNFTVPSMQNKINSVNIVIANSGNTANDTVSCYHNGTFINSLNIAGGEVKPESIDPLYVGGLAAIQYTNFIGNIYSIKLYNRALSQLEVQQNFNSIRTRYGI